jgi:hypothetical protein
MDQDRKTALSKTSLIVLLMVVTFTLGRYSIQFLGDGWAWTSLVLHTVCLVGILYLLLRDVWKQA